MVYLRIGTKYYKLINTPFVNENGEQILVKKITPWRKSLIAQDHGLDFLNKELYKFDSKESLPNDILELYNQLPKSQRWLGR